MSTLSTHVLDTARGGPAANLAIQLEEKSKDGGWRELSRATTNPDGRAPSLLPSTQPLEIGTYRLTFDTKGYFQALGMPGFYPYVQVVFEIAKANEHYHVPLLLSPFGYSTYRGS
jgi:5-hydroxyisourate hydrolase